MTDKPIKVDDIDETTVYVASLELRSVGSSKSIFPQLKWSHMFSEEPSTVPYAYQAALAIAEKIGAIVTEEEIDEEVPEELGNEEEVVRALNSILKAQKGEGDDTIH